MACELLGSALWACELLGVACELLGSALWDCELLGVACELLGRRFVGLRVARKPLGSAASSSEASEACECWFASRRPTKLLAGRPLKAFGGSLQALLSPRDCLSSGPHVAESTGLRSAEF